MLWEGPTHFLSSEVSRASSFLGGGGRQGLEGTESSPGSEQAQSDPWDPAQDRGQVLATQRLLSEVGRPAGRWRTEREVYHQAWVSRV